MIKVHLKVHNYEYDRTNNIIKFFMTNIEACAFKMGVMITAKLGELEVEDIMEKLNATSETN